MEARLLLSLLSSAGFSLWMHVIVCATIKAPLSPHNGDDLSITIIFQLQLKQSFNYNKCFLNQLKCQIPRKACASFRN